MQAEDEDGPKITTTLPQPIQRGGDDDNDKAEFELPPHSRDTGPAV